MIDLHTHVLPGLDDGAKSLADSVAICRAAAEGGTTTIVATPHVSPQWPLNTPPIITTGVNRLRDALSSEGVALVVLPGAEVALTPAGGMTDEQLAGYHLGGGPWLLVECPYAPSLTGFDAILYSLHECGHRIVLAHPERCLAFHRDPAALGSFVRAGMLCSITAGSLTRRFGRTVLQFAPQLLRDGLVHIIASDAHNLTHRPPLSAADLRSADLLETAPDWFVESMPRAILDGTELPPPEGSEEASPPAEIAEPPHEPNGGLISEVEAQLMRLRQEVTLLHDERTQAHEQRDEAYRDRDRAREERDRAEAWLASVASELEHVERKLAERRAEFELLVRDLAARRVELERLKDDARRGVIAV